MSTNVTNILQHKHLLKVENLDKAIENMATQYFQLTEKEQILLEHKLKDRINDIDKISFVSLVFVFLLPILSKLLVNSDVTNIILSYGLLYTVIGIVVAVSVRNYRRYKFALEVISDIKQGRVIKVKNTNNNDIHIEYINKF